MKYFLLIKILGIPKSFTCYYVSALELTKKYVLRHKHEFPDK